MLEKYLERSTKNIPVDRGHVENRQIGMAGYLFTPYTPNTEVRLDEVNRVRASKAYCIVVSVASHLHVPVRRGEHDNTVICGMSGM